MRILQFPAPIKNLLDKGIDLATMSYMHIPEMVLFDDGTSEGPDAYEKNDFKPKHITRECGLILTAKNATTMLRGLSQMNQASSITGEGGLAVVAMRWKRPGTGFIVPSFFKFAANHAKQSFIHDTFQIAVWLNKHHYHPKTEDPAKTKKLVSKSLNRLFHKVGGDHLFTFADFKKLHGRDGRLSNQCAMLLVCLNSSVRNDEGGPNITVIRNINRTMTPAELFNKASQAFKGKGGGQGHHVAWVDGENEI
jgi:hypothetical protein